MTTLLQTLSGKRGNFLVNLTQDSKKKEGQDDCLERRQSKRKEKEDGIGGS